MPIDDLIACFAEESGRATAGPPPLRVDARGVSGRYRGLRLHSAFQPLQSATTLQPAAHEALLRVRGAGNRAVPPADAFALPDTPGEVVYLDRLCRTLHVLNFVRQDGGGGMLYLNVSGRHLLSVGEGRHGRAFETLLGCCGIRPDRIVLEIVESGVDDLHPLQAAVGAYRARGYRVAIDDFGCQHSNFDRLWRLEPDIVKLDRSLIVQSAGNPRVRRILPKLIDIIHDLDALAVCEGIETAEQHRLAIDAGADLLQGFHYARPSPRLALPAARPAPRPASEPGLPRHRAA